MARLPASFLDRPIAHRALHDLGQNRPENSRAAITAAIAGNYGIEIDLQLSRDGVAMVFHDYDLDRLTGQSGLVCDFTAAELSAIPLLHGNEGIPTLREVLELVSGRVPLLIEIKDQTRIMGPDVGALEQATARDLQGYQGDVALMSFNPYSVIALRDLCPDIPRGFTTCAYRGPHWEKLPLDQLATLRGFDHLENMDACFISHHHEDLTNPKVAEIAAKGYDVLCWTITSHHADVQARKVAKNVTFEGYRP